MPKTPSTKSACMEIIVRGALVMLGAIIAAYGLESVLIPNQVSDGGVTGLSIVGSQLFGLPLGLLIGILNIPFVILGYKQIGKDFAIYSVLGIATLAVSTSLMHHVPTIIRRGYAINHSCRGNHPRSRNGDRFA